MRTSAAHRARVAANLLRRLWLETRPVAPLPARRLNVFDVMPHAAPAA
jgi:xanthine dehydrogenase small subunit